MQKYECIAFCIGMICILGTAAVTKSAWPMWAVVLLLMGLSD